MGKTFIIDLEGKAGKLGYYHPSKEEAFKPKAWRVELILNGSWARRALALPLERTSQELQRRGYEEQPGWPSSLFTQFKKYGDVIYMFANLEGSLVRGMLQLTRDIDLDPRIDNPITYHDTNTDLKAQQDRLIALAQEYVGVVSVSF